MNALVRHLPVIDAEAPVRPRTRGECAGGERPCPWVSCEHHAIHGVLATQGRDLDDDGAVALIETLAASCTLDVADARRDGDESDATLETVGAVWGVTRERARQIEAKALKAVRRAAEHLREEIVEEPLVELKPSRGGAAPPVEDRRRTEAPAQHAHLATPETVREGAEGMWCPWMGAAVTGALCVRRHGARTRGSVSAGGNPGTAWPTYPGCASCADGAAVAARLGGGGELVPLRVAVPAQVIDWMGDGESPANDLDAPAAMGAAEDHVSKMRASRSGAERMAAANAARTTTPAARAMCRFPGCGAAQLAYRAGLDEALRPLCSRHRLRAMSIRSAKKIGAAEAVAMLLAGAGKRHATRAELASTPPQDSAELALVRQDRDDVRAERDRLASELAAARQETARVVAEAEGLRAEVVTSPWARLTRLAAALRPGVEVSWAITRERAWEAMGVVVDGATLWVAEGADPDAAVAALVALVEGEARARVAEITSALDGAL